MPFVIEQGKHNLNKPVRLYSQLAIDSARSIDSLFTDSLMTLARDLPAAEKNDLIKARDAAMTNVASIARDTAGAIVAKLTGRAATAAELTAAQGS